MVLVAGSSAFAVANGIFVARPASHVGALPTTQARLVPRARLSTTLTSPAVPNPRLVRLPVPAAAVAPLATAPLAVSALPTPTFAVTTSPPIVTRATTATVARSGPSAVPGKHSEDDHELREDGHGDD